MALFSGWIAQAACVCVCLSMHDVCLCLSFLFLPLAIVSDVYALHLNVFSYIYRLSIIFSSSSRLGFIQYLWKDVCTLDEGRGVRR